MRSYFNRKENSLSSVCLEMMRFSVIERDRIWAVIKQKGSSRFQYCATEKPLYSAISFSWNVHGVFSSCLSSCIVTEATAFLRLNKGLNLNKAPSEGKTVKLHLPFSTWHHSAFQSSMKSSWISFIRCYSNLSFAAFDSTVSAFFPSLFVLVFFSFFIAVGSRYLHPGSHSFLSSLVTSEKRQRWRGVV